MNKTFKRTFATIAAFSLLSCSALATEVDPAGQPELIAENPIAETAPVINGATLDSVPTEDVNGVVMVPLRAVCEGLGFQVNWIAETQSIEVIKGAVYITMSIDTDSYAFSRRAPQQLGAAPTLVNDSVTYVPLAFITELLNGYYTENEDGTVKIVNPSIVTVTEIQENGSLLVSDSALGEVIVLIDENTQITANGNAVSADAIQADMVLAIEYSEAMTASLPPRTTAIAIRIENVEESVEEEAPVVESVAFEGTITEIIDNMVVLGNPEKDPTAIAIMVDDNTQITRGMDRRIYKIDDLEVGMKLSGTHADYMTMSIPPQTLAYTIEIQVEEEAPVVETTVAFEGTITEIIDNMVILGNPEEDSKSIALIIDDNTQITKGMEKRIYKIDDLEVGMQVSGTHADQMTMSLPPQSVALTLVIEAN